MRASRDIGHIVILTMTILLVAMKAVAADADATGQQLLRLAETNFTCDLWPAEKEMFRNRGAVDCTPFPSNNINKYVEGKNDANTDDAASWSTNRVIRADRLVWLCTDPDASKLVSFRGIQIRGARIDGIADFSAADISFPIKVTQSAFTDDCFLNGSHLPSLDLSGTHVKAVEAKWVKVDARICLGGGFKAEGFVNLHGASIGADLDCGDAHFTCKERDLELDESKISGSVWLSGKNPGDFNAEGMITLINTTIGGKLNCTKGWFNCGKENNALIACGASISGSADLVEVQAHGAVSFSDAIIGGNLDCGKGIFRSDGKKNNYVLKVERAKIGGSVWLNKGFLAEGPVTIEGASIGGNFECEKGQFIKDTNNTSYVNAEFTKVNGRVNLDGIDVIGRVDFQNAEVANEFIWTETSTTNVQLDLQRAKVGTLIDDPNSWPATNNLYLQDFVYDRIQSLPPDDATSRIAWLGRQPTNTFLPQPYEQLAAVFRNMGLEDEAVTVLIEKNREHARFTTIGSSAWWWYEVFGRFIRYGYRPWPALLASAFFLLAGWVLFMLGHNPANWPDRKVAAIIRLRVLGARALIEPADHDRAFPNGQSKLDRAYPKFNAFVYSLETFVPLVKLEMGDYWMPNANRGRKLLVVGKRTLLTTGGLLRIYFWIHIIAGWILTTLLVGAFTGLIKT